MDFVEFASNDFGLNSKELHLAGFLTSLILITLGLYLPKWLSFPNDALFSKFMYLFAVAGIALFIPCYFVLPAYWASGPFEMILGLLVLVFSPIVLIRLYQKFKNG